MRFKLIFSVDREKSPLSILPLHYQYPVSCWFYKSIREGNPDYKGWLKRNGFISPRHVFNQFTFSNFLMEEGDYELHGDRIMLLSDRIEIILSSLVNTDISSYVNDLFLGQELSLGDNKSRVFFTLKEVVRLEEKLNENPKLKLISPVAVSIETQPDEKKLPEHYLSPKDDEYKYYFFKRLIEKDRIKNGKDPSKTEMDLEDIEMEILTKPEIFETPVRSGNGDKQIVPAYQFEFQVQAPMQLIKNGLEAGFGILNHKGFGCAEVIEEEEEYPYFGKA